MLQVIIPVLIGAGAGAALGYFGQCSSGSCPLTSTWWRGALYGAALGLMFGLLTPRTSATQMNASTKNVKRIAENSFDAEVLQASTPVVVDFYATWCGPCQRLSPKVDALADQFSGKIKFVKVNVDEAAALAQRYSISSIPALVIFEGGKVVDKMVGLPPSGALEKRLESLAVEHR